jgi:hypothetical protein
VFPKWGEAYEEGEVCRTRFQVIVCAVVVKGVIDEGGVIVELGT